MKLFFYILFGIQLTMVTTHAKPLQCVQVLETKSSPNYRLPIINKDQIRSFLEMNGMDERVYMEAFQLYLHGRMKHFDHAQKEEIFDSLNTFKFEYSSNPRAFEGNAGKVELPLNFKNTPIPFFIAVHEFEHLIQLQRHGINEDMGWARGSAEILQVIFGAVRNYRWEQEAMMAEWDFLSAVPPSHIAQALEIVQASELPQNRKDFLTIALSNSHLEMPAYIKAHHRVGRYDPAGVILNAGMCWLTALGMPISILTMIGVF